MLISSYRVIPSKFNKIWNSKTLRIWHNIKTLRVRLLVRLNMAFRRKTKLSKRPCYLISNAVRHFLTSDPISVQWVWCCSRSWKAHVRHGSMLRDVTRGKCQPIGGGLVKGLWQVEIHHMSRVTVIKTHPPCGAMVCDAWVLVGSIDRLPRDSPTTSFTTDLICLGRLSSKSCLNESMVMRKSSARTRVNCAKSPRTC
jgi:hypothetical protein